MGRSASSCLKIIACGSETAESDDIDVPEAKGSGDKRGWSFRKRSGSHRVLSNTVTLETPSSGNKEALQATNTNFLTSDKAMSSEKDSASQIPDEKTQLPVAVESKTTDTVFATENGGDGRSAETKASGKVVFTVNAINEASGETKVSETVDTENVSTEIQAQPKVSDAVAATENGSSDSIVKDEMDIVVIQSAIRRFLTQRDFMQLKSAIKLQAAIRGYLVRRHAVDTLHCIRAIVKVQAVVRAHLSKLPGKENYVAKPVTTQFSAVKLLRNGLARQLLLSTPKPKSMNVRCDPLRADSAWGWLERWMSVSTETLADSPKPELYKQDQGITSKTEAESPEIVLGSADSVSSVNETIDTFENEMNYHTSYGEMVDSESSYTMSAKTEPSHAEKADSASFEIDSSLNQYSRPQLSGTFDDKAAGEDEHVKRSSKRVASDQLDTDGKKFTYGSQRVSNPSFIAVQSKFEELSSTTNSGRSLSLSPKESGVESHSDTAMSAPENGEESKERDISKFEAVSPKRELNVLNSHENALVETKGMPSLPASDLPSSVSNQEEEVNEVNDESENRVVDEVCPPIERDLEQNVPEPQNNFESVSTVVDAVASQTEQKLEKSESNVQAELISGIEHQPYKSSPEASPKSHLTIPESQGTPSSQVSVKPKTNKGDKSGSNPKRTSRSAGKKSPSHPSRDSSGKRRNSFGSVKSDNVEPEPRDNGSGTRSSLPSYMQATESARAKVHSPRSSPDVQEKEFHSNKRHSLPVATGKHGSPRIQQSVPQATPGVKTNGAHSSHERRWQR